MHSDDDDDEEQSGDDFRKNIDFGRRGKCKGTVVLGRVDRSLSSLGIDRTLSARIERDEKENMNTPAHNVSRSLNYTENSGR